MGNLKNNYVTDYQRVAGVTLSKASCCMVKMEYAQVFFKLLTRQGEVSMKWSSSHILGSVFYVSRRNQETVEVLIACFEGWAPERG